MADSTTTESKDFSFSFEKPKPIFEPTPFSQPYLAGPGRWDNYTDDKLYEMECLLREFLKTKVHGWGNSSSSARKFTAKMMYQTLYGSADDYKVSDSRRMNRLLTYYCTKKFGRSPKGDNRTTIFGKMQTANVYLMNAMRHDMKPYSLRLRLEWLELQGKLPTYENMSLE